MLIVAIDTSGRHGSVALCRGDAVSLETLQLTALEGGTYSARLMPSIASLLDDNKLEKSDVDGFVVVSGPGSFTGLRVGLATVKGFCEVLGKPLAAVSTLEALASVYGAAGETVTTLLDAGRGEVYVGEYRIGKDGAAEFVREYIVKVDELAAETSVLGPRVLTTSAAAAEILTLASSQVALVAPLRADAVARIGLRKLLAGDVADVSSIDVNYIRRSDAEIFSKPK